MCLHIDEVQEKVSVLRISIYLSIKCYTTNVTKSLNFINCTLYC